MVSESITDKELPTMYLLGEKYVKALGTLAESNNSKFVLLPGDIPEAVRSLLGRRGNT